MRALVPVSRSPAGGVLAASLLLVLVGAGCREGAPGGPPPGPVPFDWAAFEEGMRAYAARPSPANADAVARLVPRRGVAPDYAAPGAGSAVDALLAGLPVLEARVGARDSAALGLALRLRRMCSGHVCEELDTIAGSAIEGTPTTLLRALQAERPPSEWADGGLVSNLGPAYVDRPEAQQVVLAARRDALLAVDAPDVAAVRDSVVAEIEASLRDQAEAP